MEEEEITPSVLLRMLNLSIFNHRQPSVRAEGLIKLMDQKNINKFLKYILKYSAPNLKDLVQIIEDGISKTSFDSLPKLENDLNRIQDRINTLKIDNLEMEIERTAKKARYLEELKQALVSSPK